MYYKDPCQAEPQLIAFDLHQFLPDGRALHTRTFNQSTVQTDYVWLDNLPVAQFQDSYDAQGVYIGTDLTYLHADHLGTPRIGTSQSRQITWRYQSDGFGVPAVSGTAVVQLRFPGQLALGIGGLHYNYFRDYEPQVGRYLESDPIGLDGGPNTYGYVGQNSLRYFDPYGLCRVEVRYKKVIQSMPWYHAYVVTTDPDGTQEYFRGGPSGSPVLGSAWGYIRTEYGDYGPATPDWDPDQSNPQVVLRDDDLSCGCLEASFKDSLDEIEALRIPYSPALQNSNSVIGTMLMRAGFPSPSPVNAPAIRRNLLRE